MKGHLGPYLNAECGRCGQTQVMDGPTRPEAFKQMENRGWVERVGWGWVCPNCVIATKKSRFDRFKPRSRKEQYNDQPD